MSSEGGSGCEDVSLRRGLILAAMSGGFELQPQDGGPRLALAPGETVIGRGPLLGVSVARGSAGPGASCARSLLAPQAPLPTLPRFSTMPALPVWILDVWGVALLSLNFNQFTNVSLCSF